MKNLKILINIAICFGIFSAAQGTQDDKNADATAKSYQQAGTQAYCYENTAGLSQAQCYTTDPKTLVVSYGGCPGTLTQSCAQIQEYCRQCSGFFNK